MYCHWMFNKLLKLDMNSDTSGSYYFTNTALILGQVRAASLVSAVGLRTLTRLEYNKVMRSLVTMLGL